MIGSPAKSIAPPVFAADAIASSALAPEEILRVLVPVGGMAALDDLIPISLVVVALLVIVVTSYLQTITSYPGGGESYVMSWENLGVVASLVAVAARRRHRPRRPARGDHAVPVGPGVLVGCGIDLEIVDSEFRDVTGPVMRYLDELDARWADDIIDVIIPEFVIQHWWQQVPHNQVSLAIKARLHHRRVGAPVRGRGRRGGVGGGRRVRRG